MKYFDKYYDGVFWIPGNEKHKVIGTLQIDSAGDVKITTLISIKGESKGGRPNWDKIEVAFGYIKSHENSKTCSVKLYDLFTTEHTIGGLNGYAYKSSCTLLSNSFDKKIFNLKYNTIMLGSEVLDNWTKIRGADFKLGENDDFEVNLKYKQPKVIDLFKNKEFHIYLYFRAYNRFQGRRNISIIEEVFINIETKSQLDLEESLKIKLMIERLLSIVFFIPFRSKKIELKTASKSTYERLQSVDDSKYILDTQLKFESFRENSQEIISNWIQKQSKLRLSIVNFFSVYGQKGVLVENRFLSYISVLENYHKNHIKSNCKLKDRIQFIFNKSVVAKKISDLDTYCKKLKTTRNYYTHLEEKHEKMSFNPKELINQNIILEFIIREVFLYEIGVKKRPDVSNIVEYLTF